MLMEQTEEGVKPFVCEQPEDNRCKTPAIPAPRRLLIKWRGGDAPSVSEWLCWDAAAAYMYAEHMAGIRDGDTVILYALNWQSSWCGRA